MSAPSSASTPSPPHVTLRELIERHAALFLDAYGVLLHHAGPLPHAVALISDLCARKQPFLILTNDAARSPASTAARLQAMGLAIHAEQIVSSGSLIAPYFAEHQLEGARCTVLGPEDSLAMVRAGHAELVPAGHDAEVVVICDEVGYDFLSTVDDTLSALLRRVERDEAVHLLLPNPDLLYPKCDRGVGIAAGSIALIFEAALALRFPERRDVRFVRLGKPEAPIFERAVALVQTRNVVMIGDQLSTDIAGANRFGIPSALVLSGLSRAQDVALAAERPSYLLESLAL